MERKTDANRMASVYVHNNFRNDVSVLPEYSFQVGPDKEAAMLLAKELMKNMRIIPDGTGVITVLPMDMVIIKDYAKRCGFGGVL
jgi:hypothetical protein